MFKYELGQVVFYMKDNRMHSAAITQRTYSDEMLKDELVTKIQYAVNGTWQVESSLFTSTADIATFLITNLQAH